MLGNERVRQQILNETAHAVIITGEKGMGKRSLARLYCQNVFCEHGSLCGKCRGCKMVLSGNHPDVITLQQEKPDIIKVDEIREQVCDTAAVRPFEGKRKIYIIPDAQKMAPNSQNALLKTLEEPPEYVTILLLCADESKLLDTVSSRCVKIRTERVSDRLIREHLVSVLGVSPEEAEICTGFAKGNPGLAMELSGDEEFRALYRSTVLLLREIRNADTAAIAGFVREFSRTEDPGRLFSLFSLWYRDVLMVKTVPDCRTLCFGAETGALRAQAAVFSAEGIAEILSSIETAQKRLKANVNRELTFELLFLDMKEIR